MVRMGCVAWGRVGTVLVLAAGLAACAPVPDEATTTSPIIANRNLDVLFVVDTSSSMRLSQAKLEANFPRFIEVLETMPDGLPNVHIAVISTDMGAGDGSISGCSGLGNAGIFQSTPRGSCTNTTLAPGATFISNVGGQRNYTGDLCDVFTCIAALGESGCGFEHQLASVARALGAEALGADGLPAPAENAGFLRSDALLAIILVTNEDDCSAQAGVPLFDTSANLKLASQLGRAGELPLQRVRSCVQRRAAAAHRAPTGRSPTRCR